MGFSVHLLCISGFQPKQDFIDKSRRLYGSEPAVLKSLQQINDWVYNATNRKMPEFLSALPPNLLIMLINAVHFKGITFLQLEPQHTCASVKVLAIVLLIKFSLLPKGEWIARFDPRFTSRGVFYLDDKNMIDVEVMEDAKYPLSLFIDNELDAQVTCSTVAHSCWKSRKNETDKPSSVQVARFPFMKLMSLLVVMPTSGQVNMDSLLAELNVSDLYRRLPKERAVHVKVPKFKLEYAQELQDVFTKIGRSFHGPWLQFITCQGQKRTLFLL